MSDSYLKKPYHGFVGPADTGQTWRYDSSHGFDLTHGRFSSDNIRLRTTTKPITIKPRLTALVIIDMQNYFLSGAFGRAPDGMGIAAANQLLTHALPAARAAGIQVIWLNWGLTEEDLVNMPPAVARAFGFRAWSGMEREHKGPGFAVDRFGAPRGDGRAFGGLGSACGVLHDPLAGKDVDAGRLLMRDTWNAALWAPLQEAAVTTGDRPDVWLNKNRMSGLWGAGGSGSECVGFLRERKLTTLLFAGVNTDQCVLGSLQDAFSLGFDSILLEDGCGTSSPKYAHDGVVFNAENTYGFVMKCQSFAEDVNANLQEDSDE